MKKLRIKNWDQFQHYRHRNPPWVKLHFTLMSSEDWVTLADASKLLAVVCMMVASRNEGFVPDNPDYLKRIAYLDKRPNLKPLIECGFLEIVLADDSESKQVRTNATPETETETDISSLRSDISAIAPVKKKPLDEFKEELKAAGMSDDVLSDLIAHRRSKKAALTKRGATLVLAAATKCQLSPDQAAIKMIERNWITIEPDWLKDKFQKPQRMTIAGAAVEAIERMDNEQSEFNNLERQQGNRTYHIKPKGMSFATKGGKEWRSNIPATDTIVTQEMHDAAMMIVDAAKFHGLDKDFEGGIAEVSIFWTANGRRCKARVDYLRPDFAIDIKTLANQRGDDTERMIAKAIANERYHINAVWYQHALQAAKGMSWKANVNFHNPVHSDELVRVRQMLTSFWQHEGHFPYWFYFMETGGVPNIECRDLSPHDGLGVKNLYYASGLQAIKHATGLFELFMKKRGENTPWYDDIHKKKMTDEDLISVQWAFK